MSEKLYRVVNLGKVVYHEEYSILKRTKCGAWIWNGYRDKKRFINFSTRKKYACETLEEAFHQFIKRKERHKEILTEQLRDISHILENIDNEKITLEDVKAMTSPYEALLAWDW